MLRGGQDANSHLPLLALQSEILGLLLLNMCRVPPGTPYSSLPLYLRLSVVPTQLYDNIERYIYDLAGQVGILLNLHQTYIEIGTLD